MMRPGAMRETDVAVVGAGPAGLAAALAAAEAGARVTLLDESATPGGQYFRHPPASFTVSRTLAGRQHARGERLVEAVTGAGVAWRPGTLVWDVFDERGLMLYGDGRSEALRAGAIVLATGAYDRPVPFPGWTLPGVMTAGAAQTLVKGHGVLPGRRVLLAGSGPFLLPVAQQLVHGGARVAGVLEATGPGEWWPHAPALRGQWARLGEAWDYLGTLRRARVPVRFRRKVVAVRGGTAVEAAVVARVDRDWRAVPGTEEVVEADAVAIGYGFLPSLELADACGCALRWSAIGETWLVEVDARLLTSRPGIFAAGEITGIGGAALALEEGRLAGLGAAEHVGRLPATRAEAARRAAGPRLTGLRRFARMLDVLFAPRPGLWEGLADATVVCRCEEVTAGEIRARVAAGCTTPKQVKDWTRAGMGLCQARVCGAVVSRLVAEGTGTAIEAVPRGTVRPPIKPVPLGVLAETEVP